jgi:hypothetical protein
VVEILLFMKFVFLSQFMRFFMVRKELFALSYQSVSSDHCRVHKSSPGFLEKTKFNEEGNISNVTSKNKNYLLKSLVLYPEYHSACKILPNGLSASS